MTKIGRIVSNNQSRAKDFRVHPPHPSFAYTLLITMFHSVNEGKYYLDPILFATSEIM